MASTVDLTLKEQINDVTSQITEGTLLRKVQREEDISTNAKIIPGVYIALEGGKLVRLLDPNETLISSIIAAERSTATPNEVSQTSVATSSRSTVNVKRPTKQSPVPIVNKKHKTDIKTNEQRKKIKLDRSNRDSDSNSVFKYKQIKKLNDKEFFNASEKRESLTSDFMFEKLEDEKKIDHDYGQHQDTTNREVANKKRKKTDLGLNKEVTGDQSVLENFSKEYEEETIEVDTMLSSSQRHNDGVESLENQTVDDSRAVLTSSQSKQHVLTTSPQSNSHRSTFTKREQSQQLLCNSKVAVQKVREGSSPRGVRPRMNDKLPAVPVPAHINQVGDCLKTRLGMHHYGLTLTDPPAQFFQGVLKGASGNTLAVMFGDTDLFAKLESIPLDEIGHFVIDTTYKVIPNSTEGVNRLFTVSLLHQNAAIPLWYAITSCSSTELYKRILIEFQQHFLDWPFTTVLVDNDPAVCNAVRAVFPGVDIYGSWYHYCYSIWQEINRHNLTGQCREEDSVLLLAVKLLMVVPYLPPTTGQDYGSVDMADGFEYVNKFALENNLPEEFFNVLEYVSEFWFEKVKPDNFTLFGKHTSALNHVELLQLLLLSYAKQNGNVWILTRSFQSIARSTYTDFIKFLNGKKQMAKKNRGKKFIVPISLNMRKLIAGSLDVKTYLEKSMIYLEDILNIFHHPLYPTTCSQKTNYIHSEGWTLRIYSD